MEDKRYFGCLVRQRKDEDTVSFFVFHARAKDIKQWVGIRRVQEHQEGTQRVLRETRKKAITRFIKSNPINTIPNSILIAFGENTETRFFSLKTKFEDCLTADESNNLYNQCDSQLDWGFLEFSFEPEQLKHIPPALIIDGQHRFYGISDYENEDLPLLIVSLVKASLLEQAFQFIVINNKAVRVPAESAKSIIANVEEEQLKKRLLEAGVNYGKQSVLLIEINDLPSSPFKDLLNWSYNKTSKKLIEITAIEQAIRYLKAQFTFLDKEEDTDSLIEIFCAIWRAIKDNYPSLWEKENKFMTKVNINAMNEFIVERLKYAWELGYIDIFESSEIEKQVARIFNQEVIPSDFWELNWSIKVQDNANVRAMIKKDLDTMSANSKMKTDWYTDLKLPRIMEMASEEDS